MDFIQEKDDNMHMHVTKSTMQLTFDKINGNEEGEEQEFVEIKLLFLLYFHSIDYKKL